MRRLLVAPGIRVRRAVPGDGAAIARIHHESSAYYVGLAPDLFRVVTGGLTGRSDRKWLLDHLPEDGSVVVTDASSAWCTLGVWGPNARDLVSSLTDDLARDRRFGRPAADSARRDPARAIVRPIVAEAEGEG